VDEIETPANADGGAGPVFMVAWRWAKSALAMMRAVGGEVICFLRR